MADSRIATNAADATRHLLVRLWEKNLPLLQERLRQLERAADEPEAEESMDAAAIAHKLAGSLGMFGYPRATELARQLEELFEAGGAAPVDLKALVRSLRAEVKVPE